MAAWEALSWSLVAFAAFVVKGVTGFGPSVIVVSIGAWLFRADEAVAVVGVLDLIGGCVMLLRPGARTPASAWVPMAVGIVIGGVLGTLALGAVDGGPLRRLIGGATLLLSAAWLTGLRARRRLGASPPGWRTPGAWSVGFGSGISGGLVGIDGPLLVWYASRLFDPAQLVPVLVRVFLAGAGARVLALAATGHLDAAVGQCVAAAVPGVALGVIAGSQLAAGLDERWFRLGVGAVLATVGLKNVLY